MSEVIGIDLGTTNTVVAIVRDGQASALTDATGTVLIPSVVSFDRDGSVLVGAEAKERRVVDASNTIYSIKRLIGRSWGSPEVGLARSRFPFEMREGPGQAALVVARGETYTLPEISAFVLRKAKSVAEAALGTAFERAVITVPASFNDLQRAATKVAGRVAGLEVLRILNEPTAAALAYGFGRANSERLAVYDFGGGTFDVTLLDLSDNVFEVLATSGNSFLGGDDIDLAIADRMAEEVLLRHRYDPRKDLRSFEGLRVSAEFLKRQLSSDLEASVDVESFDRSAASVPSFTYTMTRTQLERLIAPIVDRTFEVCREALAIARRDVSELDDILLVGGSTHIPLVQRRVAEFFQREARFHTNPEEVVGLGAAIQASALTSNDRRSGSVPPVPAVARRARAESALPELPTARSWTDTAELSPPLPVAASSRDESVTFVLEDEEIEDLGALPPAAHLGSTAAWPPAPLQRYGDDDITRKGRVLAVPDDEATQVVPSTRAPLTPRGGLDELPLPQPLPLMPMGDAAPRSGSVRPAPDPRSARPAVPLLIDVTPLTLTVETVRGFCDTIIPRNTQVPCAQTRDFVTAADLQTVVRVRVAQGESRRFDENTLLGEVELPDLQPQPRGVLQIAVTFALDSNGMLSVTALERTSGRATAAQLRLLGLPDAQQIATMTARLRPG